MKRFLEGLGVFAIVLSIGLAFNVICSIFKPDTDICNVSSKTSDGIAFISQYKVKFLPHRVIGTLWADFYISKDGKYVFDFSEDAQKETISYRDLDAKFVSDYQLYPQYDNWQALGVYIVLIIGVIISAFGEGLWNIILFLLDAAS